MGVFRLSNRNLLPIREGVEITGAESSGFKPLPAKTRERRELFFFSTKTRLRGKLVAALHPGGPDFAG